MVEYNYLCGFLQNYGIQISQVQRGSKHWQDVTQHFAKELYNTLYLEEERMLGNIKVENWSQWII